MILLNSLQILVEQQSLNIVWTQTRDWVFCNKISVSDAKKNIKFQQYADFLKTDICLYLGSSCDHIQQQGKDESIPSSKTGRWLSSWLNWEISIGENQIQQINHIVLVQGKDTYWNQSEKPEFKWLKSSEVRTAGFITNLQEILDCSQSLSILIFTHLPGPGASPRRPCPIAVLKSRKAEPC